jgi:hypothetical protein
MVHEPAMLSWYCTLVQQLLVFPIQSPIIQLLQGKCEDQLRWSHAYLKICGHNFANAIQFKAEFNSIPNIWKYRYMYIDEHMF